MAWAQSAGSWVSSSSPLSPSATTVVSPPTAAAIDRRAGGLRLGGDEAERLVVRRHGDHRRGRVPDRELGRRDRRHEPDDVGDRAARSASSARASGCSRPVPGGAADDRDDEPRPQVRARASSSRATARSSTSGALSGWSRPANSTTWASERQPELLARGVGVPRPEHGQVDPRVDDLDPAGVGVVQVDQLLGLEVGARDQHVGGLDHLLLADDPGRRLGGVADGHGVVLDLGHRVHRVHERDAPAVARERADLAGEPVVGVHQVVVAERQAGLGPQHLAGEHAQLARAARPWSAPRTGRHGCCGR